MQLRRIGAELEVWAPAKLNLFLEVLAKRSDGFHEIETLMCPVNLYDTLYFREEVEGRITLTCEDARPPKREVRAGTVPEGPDNLVVRAVKLLQQTANVSLGATLRLVKRIPIAAGMAGGSSDAAAALVAANAGWRLGFSSDKLQELAAQLGSDVPFFLGRGAAVCRGRGERVEPVDRLGGWHFVVVCPPEGLSTADVYRGCQPAQEARLVGPLITSLQVGDLGGVGKALHNRLQESAERLSPAVLRMRGEFSRLDLVGHQMSGSGTSYFGICRHAQHARQAAAWLQGRGVGDVYTLTNCL